MLLANGKALCKYYSGVSTRNFTLLNISNTSVSITGLGTSAIQNLYSAINLWVGDGTTAPTPQDYAMESIVSSLTNISTSHTGGGQSNYSVNNQLVYTRVYKNNTASPITISEAGLYITYTFGQTTNSYLLTRDVFTPVTIQPEESYTVTVTIG